MTESANVPTSSNDRELRKRTLLAMLGAFGVLAARVVGLSLRL